MPRRPAFAPATAALSALLALTACQSSPEAGHPNTSPPASTTTNRAPATTSTPTAPATPTWTAEEQAAITAAGARYRAARAAAGQALQHPDGRHQTKLEAAGNGGAWLQSILARLDFFEKHALYQTGTSKIVSTAPSSVDLTAEQPTVILKTCIDGSGVQMRYRSTGKPVPVASTVGGVRNGIIARLVYAANASGKEMWFLVEEKSATPC